MDFNKIVSLCDQRRISIAELAKIINVSKPNLYRSIQIKSMKVETLEKIAKALNVTVYEFFDLPELSGDEFPFIPGDIQKIIEQPLKDKIDSLMQQLEGLEKSLEICHRENSKLMVKLIAMQDKVIDQASGSM